MELLKEKEYNIQYKDIDGLEKFTGMYKGNGYGLNKDALLFINNKTGMKLFASERDIVKINSI